MPYYVREYETVDMNCIVPRWAVIIRSIGDEH
jgi:hypothetical protein